MVLDLGEPVVGTRPGERVERGHLRRLGRAAAVGERLAGREIDAGKVLCDARREQVDRDTGDDLIDPEADRRDGVQDAADQTSDEPTDDQHPGAARVVGEVGGEPGAEDHLPLEPDVHDAGSLRPQTAETGQHDRNGRVDRGAERAAGREPGLVTDHPGEADQREAEDDGQDQSGGGAIHRHRPASHERRRGVDEARPLDAHAGTPSVGSDVSATSAVPNSRPT